MNTASSDTASATSSSGEALSRLTLRALTQNSRFSSCVTDEETGVKAGQQGWSRFKP